MGLMTNNYTLTQSNLTIPFAYARITSLSIQDSNWANATLSIQQSREDTKMYRPLATYDFSAPIDKNLPIYTQLYNILKTSYCKGWQDDIVEEEEQDIIMY